MDYKSEMQKLLDRAKAMDEQLKAYEELNENLNKQFEAHRFNIPLNWEDSIKADQDKKKEKILQQAETEAEKFKQEYINREFEKAGITPENQLQEAYKELAQIKQKQRD